MTLLNKTLYGCPDQESFYDVVDALDMQNMDRIETRYREKKGVDKKGTHGFLIFTFIYQHKMLIENKTGPKSCISIWTHLYLNANVAAADVVFSFLFNLILIHQKIKIIWKNI